MPFLRSAFVYLAAAVVVVPLAARVGLGSVLGYLVAGAIVGPQGLGLSGDAEGVLHVAELGVVLLLFLVGLELDPRRLVELRRDVFGLGALQVLVTSLAIAGVAVALGIPWRAAAVAGLGLSLSSTALVVQLLGERNELGTRHGQLAFAILLFQDLAVIPMLALLPALDARAHAAEPVWLTVAKAVAVVGGVVVASRLVARPVFRFVASLRNPELFTATALLLVAGTALAVSAAGLSMALGAFLAGVLLATSEYRHELEADVAPFKGLLLGLFFLAVGMTADLRVLVERPLAVAAVVAGLVALKTLVAFAVGRRSLGRAEPALALGVLLSQGGEFGFVLFRLAASDGVMDPGLAALLVVAVTLSMATTPVLFAFHARVVRRRLGRGPAREFDVLPEGDPPVVIAGFGRVGQVVGRVLRAKHIPFTAIDASPEHIDFIRRFGNKVFYGDVSRLDLLRSARVERARLFVLAIDDVDASVRTAEVVREHFPQVAILARARNRQHAYRLRRLGIRRIVRETLHSSLVMTSDVLQALGVDYIEARTAVERFREHDEAQFEASWQHQDDLDKLTDIARRGREELEKLFEEDARERSA
ncbi:monovalent cation:proton antiporter-2 (CPA2) family protein [Anaeromyxobacter terrae]|uniref:monovalent cation:proton antiporter-2 (CPA2) family protein n=1 Tax=Anaeromyxobacter terrae TaxID=2925406 RepID=UPI001F597269|nr:monovalent cation:proton antiporter-2 (CPA2) family protein [Anaeromyxobacter sp. SG22]